MRRAARQIVSDPDLYKAQESMLRVLNPLAKIALMDGRLVGPVVITTDWTSVVHGLDRQPQGWFIISPKQPLLVWEDTEYPVPLDPQKVLRLRATGNITTLLWVF